MKHYTKKDVQLMGKASEDECARFLLNLIEKDNGSKGLSRQFRKDLRAAGFGRNAGCDIRKVKNDA